MFKTDFFKIVFDIYNIIKEKLNIRAVNNLEYFLYLSNAYNSTKVAFETYKFYMDIFFKIPDNTTDVNETFINKSIPSLGWDLVIFLHRIIFNQRKGRN